MSLPSEPGWELDRALLNATAELRRAVRAAEIAARHETRAASAVEGMRAFHGRMATVHRQAEQQHRTAARIHTAHADRLRRWAEGAANPQSQPGLMAAVAETLNASGTALTLFSSDGTQTPAAASDPAARAAQHLEFLLGQGPAQAAVRLRHPVTAAGEQMRETWPIYGPAVAHLGIRAVAAVPVAMTGTTLGALTVFDPPMTPLPDLESFRAAASTLAASLAADFASAGAGEPAAWPAMLGQAQEWNVVNQAVGMVCVQCDCSAANALALIRAHAFAQDRPVEQVAADIVGRRLRLR